MPHTTANRSSSDSKLVFSSYSRANAPPNVSRTQRDTHGLTVLFLPWSQYYPHFIHGPRLFDRRLAQHLLLQRFRILRGHRQLLRSLLYRCLFLPDVPLHCARSTQSEGLLSRYSTQGLGVAAELVPEVEVLLRTSRGLAQPAQRPDLVQCM